MGVRSFVSYADSVDIKDAFMEAVEEAKADFGRGGYTGTIAEKTEFVIVAATPMPQREAEQLARNLLTEDDSRIADKLGPAGAIPVLGVTRTVHVDIPYRPGGHASDREAVLEGLKASGELRDGERLDKVLYGAYDTDDNTHQITGGTLVVTVTGGEPTHVGWLFFGFAST